MRSPAAVSSSAAASATVNRVSPVPPPSPPSALAAASRDRGGCAGIHRLRALRTYHRTLLCAALRRALSPRRPRRYRGGGAWRRCTHACNPYPVIPCRSKRDPA